MNIVPRKDWIDSLVRLGENLNIEQVPHEIIDIALEGNPWFTKYYIEKALEGIRPWLEIEQLKSFVEPYNYASEVDRKINLGIIAAGNIPFVGFHDVICGILSGHKLSLKLSHQDKFLMTWLINEWKKIIPGLKDYLRLVDQLNNMDFLIATGSNNTARYFESNFHSIPKLIRKNRYSIAVLGSQTTDNEIESLCEDMLLYNGLGCRNVSNLILLDGFEWQRLQKKLEKYPISKVNSNYLERILFESTRKGVITQEYITSKFGLFFFGIKPRAMEMGYFNVIALKDQEDLNQALSNHQEEIQIIVGQDIPYGSSQNPALHDFADGVDTMKILTESWFK
ncbi:MAG: hypothetical protein MRZ79_14475 [Bacteroidia bacterium]|nr:hypothetical protein [Bacteroidia bacterium]